jgi:uncharacterized protein YwgA
LRTLPGPPSAHHGLTGKDFHRATLNVIDRQMLNLGSPADEDKKALPLALLQAAEDGMIEGTTRFQKLVFILQKGDLLNQEDIDENIQFDFKPHNYGPYSKELHDWLDSLAERGDIERKQQQTPAGNKKEVYQLPDGDSLENLISDEELAERIQTVVKEFNNRPLFDLLDAVYDEYPEYTVNSNL